MKARLLMVAAAGSVLLLLSGMFAYAHSLNLRTLSATNFVPGQRPMGAEIPDPTIRIQKYRENRVKRVFAVGEALNVAIVNSTGDKIWYVRRRPPGVDAELLRTESISIQHVVNNNWKEATNQYATVIDDPDGQFGPQLRRIDPDVTVFRKWTPHEPGQYRVRFSYYYTPDGSDPIKAVVSQPFRVDPK